MLAPEPESLSTAAAAGAARAVACLHGRQREDHWPSDYGGPQFLLPGLVIAHHITGTELGAARTAGMVTYLRNTQNDDGGYGLHVEGPSTTLGTGLNYVALRLLGVSPDDPDAARARACLHRLGGAEGIPTWGKFWYAVLGLYSYEGLLPMLPEIWLLPRAIPMHPGNLWCHTRAVFLPMSFIYGHGWVGPITEVVEALREEVFLTPYDEIDWSALRSQVAEGDIYTPHTRWLDALNGVLLRYQRFAPSALRRRALRFVGDLIHHEDESTGYLTIGPVSKALHMVAAHFEEPGSAAFRRHVERVEDYVWDGHDGTKMQGYNGSQFWDVAFAMQALLECDAIEGAKAPLLEETLQASHRFLDANQVRENVERHAHYFRDATRGSWPFSTAEQAWSVSDCTAEGLKVAVAMQDRAASPLTPRRLEEAADVLLESQNADGGWSEYEKARGTSLLEKFNVAEVFGDIMIAYSYVECTSACIQGLLAFRERFPGSRDSEIARAVEEGVAFIRSKQKSDGGFYGGWGVCFTYGTWFAIEGLLAADVSAEDPAIERAKRFILRHQRDDGAWGEDFSSCVEHRYVQHEDGQVVQTAWAMLGLLAAAPTDPEVLRAVGRGAEFLLASQRADGGWDREALSGVFNRNCAINYDNYRFVMPLWALSRYARLSPGP